jgi:hypothetical protein
MDRAMQNNGIVLFWLVQLTRIISISKLCRNAGKCEQDYCHLASHFAKLMLISRYNKDKTHIVCRHASSLFRSCICN